MVSWDKLLPVTSLLVDPVDVVEELSKVMDQVVGVVCSIGFTRIGDVGMFSGGKLRS